ncbi:MAG: hydrogenase maturation protease [Nitrososphaerota archaeon]
MQFNAINLLFFIQKRLILKKCLKKYVDNWYTQFDNILRENFGKTTIHLIPFGNNLRSDDGVGIYIINELRKKLRNKKNNYIKIHSMKFIMETIFNYMQKSDLIIVLDAVRANYPPGTILFERISSTKFGFFGTHNIPLKLILERQSLMDYSYLLGVVPYDLSIGEKLSTIVKSAADEIVDLLYRSIIRWSS